MALQKMKIRKTKLIYYKINICYLLLIYFYDEYTLLNKGIINKDNGKCVQKKNIQ